MISYNKLALSILAVAVLNGCQSTPNNTADNSSPIIFKDVSDEIGLISEPTLKYGGPSVSDINNDGYYDFLLTNHNATPVRLFMANGDNTYTRQPDIYPKVDLHGLSSGDYDLDGDNDILLSVGGGNGKAPKPQRLLRNDNGKFVDVTVEAGISEMGARGRAVRWVDLDSDGDLDFLQINAEKVVNEEEPRNILFENNGDGTFTYRKSAIFEDIDAERVLLTDFNGDHVMDMIAFNSYSIASVWQGNNNFTFTDVSEQYFPKDAASYKGVISAAHADIDNDGDLDYYFARGKLLYTLADNSISYDKESGRLDLRDEGNKSHDGMTLYAEGNIELTDFYHFPRGNGLERVPLFLGADKKLADTPTSTTVITDSAALGFPDKVEKTGWYLGYLGKNEWRLEWLMVENEAWDIRASISGLSGYKPDFIPKEQGVKDVLLRNDGNKFTDISDKLPKEANDNNWGVTTGDFNNDGKEDFFVHRFGKLKERISDVLITNEGNDVFSSRLMTDATTEIGNDSHGDMGTAFDYDLDGKIDLLNGDDDNGQWHMYRNETDMQDKHYLLARIGYSVSGLDPLGAKITIETDSTTQYKLVGSSSASHSQSVLNITHFGLGKDDHIKSILVRWRDGSEEELHDVKADQVQLIGQFK